MILVKEYQNSNEVFYELQIKDSKSVTATYSLHHRSFIKNYNGKEYLMMYNPEMKPISEAFGFLNNYKIKQSFNTKVKDSQALKLLFAFQSVIDKKLADFTAADIESLKIFISGQSLNGQTINFELITKRNIQTVNEYLGIYRKYLTYLDEANAYLTDKNETTIKYTHSDTDAEYNLESYTSNERLPNKVIEVPRYISVEEFRLIIDEIRKNYGKKEEIIIGLMFQLGLRIGETLGLTGDDIVMEKIEHPAGSSNYIFAPIVYIRNRVSDKNFQKAKRLMQVTDRAEYKSKAYQTLNYGFNKIVLSKDLYELINEYIEEEHAQYLKKACDKTKSKSVSAYNKHTIADRVRKSKRYELPNYYIFINSLGKPLSQTLWNVTSRNIFQKLGIEVDRDVKEHNLNHRYHHGFAMFHVQYKGTQIIELKELMRHDSIQSTAKYYRPTTSDAIKLKTKFTESLYKFIPELKRKE